MVIAVVGPFLHRGVQEVGTLRLDGALLRGGGLHLFFYGGGSPAAGVHDPKVVLVHADPKQAVFTPVGSPAVTPNPVPAQHSHSVRK